MQIPLLTPGSTVAVVVPARKVDDELLKLGLKALESWGLTIKLGLHSFTKSKQYLAASDVHRLHDMQDALDDPSVSAVFCARGGYGTTRILDQLDFGKFLEHPKWIVGFSDITALHLALHSLDVVSIHGCMPVQFSNPEYAQSVESLRKLLFTGATWMAAKNNPSNKLGTATGPMIGGNLSLLVDSLGTRSELDTSGKILLVEEIDEQLYKIDRMFTQLKRADKLGHLSGLVVGHFTDIKDTELPFNQTVEEIILDKVGEFNYPVAFDFPVGHQPHNLSWPHGALATLTVDQTGATARFS